MIKRFIIEKDHVETLVNRITQEYRVRNKSDSSSDIPEQFSHYMRWYILAAETNKWLFRITSMLTIICPAIVSVLSVSLGGDTKISISIAIISGLSSIAAVFIQLLRLVERWTQYRDSANQLKQAAEIYICNGKQPNFNAFEEKMHEINENDTNTWKRMQKDALKNCVTSVSGNT